MTQERTDGQIRDKAYQVLERNIEDGTITIRINKGILGSMGNQLKSTSSNKRKGASILRKLGYDLSEAGDFLYGKENQTEIKNEQS